MRSLNEKIQEEVQKTLQIPEGIQQVKGNPYLLTKVKARLEKRKTRTPSFAMQLPLAAMVIFILGLNSFVLFQSLDTKDSLSEGTLTEYFFPQTEESNWLDSLN